MPSNLTLCVQHGISTDKKREFRVMVQSEQDKDVVAALVMGVVRMLVSKPEAVHLSLSTNEDVITIHLLTDATDKGKLIGLGGQTARSLRSIVGAVGRKTRRRYALEIKENP